MESKKLKAKDLINVGIYTAIYIVIFFVVGMLNAIPVRLCEGSDGQAGGLVVRPVFYYAFTTFDRQMRLRYAMICGVSSETQNAGNA